jgi:hypothetical protein
LREGGKKSLLCILSISHTILSRILLGLLGKFLSLSLSHHAHHYRRLMYDDEKYQALCVLVKCLQN